MNDETEYTNTSPAWFAGNKINEVLFAEEFLRNHPMICIYGKLFTVDGLIEDSESVRKVIYDLLKQHISTGVSAKSTQLLETVKLSCYSEPLPILTDRIHLANGTYYLDKGFINEKEFCMNRLCVPYLPDAPKPERWLIFLNELLEPDDIPTLQEYIGYLFIPSTKAQKMLMLIGKGGEGKSCVGSVLRAIFGDSMSVGSIHKTETSRFAQADLEFKLLLLDDDMQLEALPQTSNLKTLITLEGKTDIERKGVQSVQRQLYARFLCFGNGMLRARNDSSYAFFRRQIVIKVKERGMNRIDDPFLPDKLKTETAGILLWAIDGLHRLIAHNYSFSVSKNAQNYLAEAERASDTVGGFMRSEYVHFDKYLQIGTSDLFRVYEEWCGEIDIIPLTIRCFAVELCDRADEFGIVKTKHINRTQQGFKGVAISNKFYQT